MAPARGAARVALALGLCSLANSSCTSASRSTEPSSAAADRATVFVTTELKGYLGPCGCSEAMRGGIARAARQLEQTRALGTEVLYLDTGDTLFTEPTIAESAVPQAERKAQAVAASMKAMGLSARANGPIDDARGANFRHALGLPGLPATLAAGKGAVVVVEGSSVVELELRAKSARATGSTFVLGLFRGPFEAALAQLATFSPAVDLVLAVKAKDELSGEQNKLVRGAVPLAQVQTKGRSLLKLELFFRGEGHFALLRGSDDVERETSAIDQRIELLKAQVNEPMIATPLKELRQAKLAELIARKQSLLDAPIPAPEHQNAFTLHFVPLESSLPEDPKVKALVTAYDRDVGLLNVAWAKAHGQPCPPAPKDQPAFVGNKECFECHDDAFASWNASKHARGYKTLEEVGKQHHLDCVGCHVTGWQKPGGVCRIDQPDDRLGIGCESCHGPGSLHAADSDAKMLKGNTAQACTGCHDRENSPHFDFDRYLKEIIAPGHGLPVAKKPRPDGGHR